MPKLRGGIGYGLLEAGDDALQSIQLEHRLGGRLNDFFNATNLDGTKRVDPADYWTSEGLENAYVYTRGAFRYPILIAYAKLPTMGDGVRADMGFESGRATDLTHHARFLVEENEIEFEYGLCHLGGRNMDIALHNAAWLPSDYDAAYHVYQIVVKKNGAEFWLDNMLRAVALAGVGIGGTGNAPADTSWNHQSPYALGLYYPNVIAPTLTGYFMAHNGKLGIDITGNNVVVMEGEPCPPRKFPLYTANSDTQWAGASLSGTGNTSHPVPVWGYPNKTLLFQSDAAGTLHIDVYVGGDWRRWDDISLTANELCIYNINGEFPLARAVYDATNSDSIAVAELDVSE